MEERQLDRMEAELDSKSCRVVSLLAFCWLVVAALWGAARRMCSTYLADDRASGANGWCGPARGVCTLCRDSGQCGGTIERRSLVVVLVLVGQLSGADTE